MPRSTLFINIGNLINCSSLIEAVNLHTTKKIVIWKSRKEEKDQNSGKAEGMVKKPPNTFVKICMATKFKGGVGETGVIMASTWEKTVSKSFIIKF
jgi:hypothetical protein